MRGGCLLGYVRRIDTLDIAMYFPLRMQVLDALENLAQYHSNVRLLQRPAFREIQCGAASEILHYDP